VPKNLFALPSHLLCFDVILRPQKFDLVLDTGSSDLWFATSGCAGCSQNTPVLNPKSSSSLQTGTQRVSLNYGSGSASGVIARDTVTMGPFTVNPQSFGAYFPSPHYPFPSLSPSPSCKPGVLFPVGTCDKRQAVLCENGFNRSAPS
jgi:hypothetical protein